MESISDLKKQIEIQLSRLNHLEEEYLKDINKTKDVDKQLNVNMIDTEQDLKHIKEEIFLLKGELDFLKKIIINAIKRLKQTTKVEEFDRLKKTIEDMNFKDRVTKRTIHKLIEDGLAD